MTHYMIDIETTDTRPTSKVLAIAVTKFDADTIHDTLILYPSLDEQKERSTSLETMIFWLGHQDVLQKMMNQPTKSLNFCLHQINYFMSRTPRDETKVWSKSPTFDLTILRDLFQDQNIPWIYTNERDVRTAQEKVGKTKSQIPHDPLEDAIAQTIDVQKYLNL